jgi:hypothetical protein
MYGLLKNYIQLVFESKEQESFQKVLDSVSKENEAKKKKAGDTVKKKNNSQIVPPPADPYFYLRPGYKSLNQTR